MQILIPISGRSPFFPQEDYYFPKPLIEIAGRPMIDLVIQGIKSHLHDARFTFTVDSDEARLFSLDRTLQLAVGDDTRIIEKTGPTAGALCSCLLAIDALDHDQPLIVVNSDQLIDADLDVHVAQFVEAGADAGVITFESLHPRWSYIVAGPQQRVMQAVEKQVVSKHAIAGFYYFKTARTFLDAARKSIMNDASVDGNFFISASLNEVMLAGGDVMYTAIDAADYHSFYAPSRIEAFERSELAARLRKGLHLTANVSVVVPAAGEGSRFAKAGWKKPKPFIDVDGRSMLEHVIDNVAPKNSDVTLLLRSDHMSDQKRKVADLRSDGTTLVAVDRLTEGTACTVLLARRFFDNDRPLLVANSDQLVDFDVSDFVRDCLNRALDGSILVFRDPSMDPKWSFARLDNDGLVTEVAEKKPISDLATVGIYLFTRGRDFIGAAVDMIAENDRVNGEFYTCPVYNYMIRAGARIGVYEVAMDAMNGLGTPDDLRAYLSDNGLPASADAPDEPR